MCLCYDPEQLWLLTFIHLTSWEKFWVYSWFQGMGPVIQQILKKLIGPFLSNPYKI